MYKLQSINMYANRLRKIVSVLTAMVTILTISNACSRTGEAISKKTGEKYTTKGGIVFGNRKDKVREEIVVDSSNQKPDSIMIDTLELSHR